MKPQIERALLLGSSGFIGTHLARILQAEGIDVVGVVRRAEAAAGSAIVCDLTEDRTTLLRSISTLQPSVIFQLAAPGASAADDDVTVVDQTLRIMDHALYAADRLPTRPRFVLVSSSAVYGNSSGRTLQESSRPAPSTMYGVSKVLAETMALRCFRATGLPVIVARLFNTIGPGQQPSRAVPNFARQIADMKRRRSRSSISTQGLTAYRDLIDVRDAATALSVIARGGRAGSIYNICSGRAVRMGTVLRRMLSISGMSDLPIHAASDGGVAYQRGNPARLKALGWRPRFSLNRSLQDVLDDWCRRTDV